MQRRRTTPRLSGFDAPRPDPDVVYRVHHRTRRRHPFASLARLPELCSRPRTVFALLKWIVPLAVVAGLVVGLLGEIDVEVMWYPRRWVRKEIVALAPLGGCFDAQRISSAYNVSAARGPKRTEVQAGMPLRFGMDCYDFAGTIQADAGAGAGGTLFHTYWRVDLAPFGARQAWMLKSVLATQRAARLIVWSNGDLSGEPALAALAGALELRVVDVGALARGTALAGSALLARQDARAWVDGDLVRLLLLWHYGGVWVDMDSLLTRDLAPLLEHEFVTQWDCYDKKYSPFNGALMHFFRHSPYLCEFFHVMAAAAPPRAGTTDWGALLYLKLWRRLVAAGIPPFKVLPFCFSDARSCRRDNRLPDPFLKDARTWGNGLGLHGEGSALQRALEQVFAVHLHNQWEKTFPPGGWVERYLLSKYDRLLQLR